MRVYSGLFFALLLTAFASTVGAVPPTLPNYCQLENYECTAAKPMPQRWDAEGFVIDYNQYPDPPLLPPPYNYGHWDSEGAMFAKRAADAETQYSRQFGPPQSKFCGLNWGAVGAWAYLPDEQPGGFVRTTNNRARYYSVTYGLQCQAQWQDLSFNTIRITPTKCEVDWSGPANDPNIGQYCYRVKKPPCFLCWIVSVGNPIDVFLKVKTQTETDWAEGLLRVERRYRSDGIFYPVGKGASPSPMGPVWRGNYDRRIAEASSTAGLVAYVSRQSGEIYRFLEGANGYRNNADTRGQLSRYGAGWKYESLAGEVETYDASGLLVEVANRQGNLVSLLYSPAGYLTDVVDERGRALHYSYDVLNRLSSIELPDGQLISYEYNAPNLSGVDIARVVFPGGTSKIYKYEFPHYSFPLLTSIVDENGATYATFTYESHGYPMSTEHAGGAGKIQVVTANPIVYDDAAGARHSVALSTTSGPYRVTGETVTCQGCTPAISATRTLHYDTAGNLDWVADFNGNKTTYTYDPQRFVRLTMTEASADVVNKRTTTTTWHPTMLLVTSTELRNASNVLESKSVNAYNTRGQVVARCEIDPADAAAMAYTCSATTAPSASAKVRRWVYEYCEAADVAAPNSTCPILGYAKSINGPRATTDAGMNGLDDITTYAYRGADDVSCATGGTCTYRKGDLWKVTNALGHVSETVAYDKTGRATRTKDANGTITDMTYSARGWMLTRTVRANANGTPSSSDATTTFAYDLAGNVTRVTQPGGVYLDYVYDAAHRLTDVIDGGGNRLHYTLDASGNRIKEETYDANYNPSQPGVGLKRSLARQVNALNRVTKTFNAANIATRDSTPFDNTTAKIQDGYDPNGNEVDFQDGLGIPTRQEFDSLDRLTKTIQDYLGTDPSTGNATTQFTYDARDNLRTLKDPGTVLDPGGLSTTYAYDGLNNQTQLVSPDTGTTTYAYDRAGNRIEQTDARGVTSTYAYDPLGRLVAIGYPTTALNVTYAYGESDALTGCSGSFPIGGMTRMTDSSGSTTYCHDRHGNVTRKTQVTAGVALVVGYAYDAADRLASITYPSGAIVDYGRDALGRIVTVTHRANATAPTTTIVSNATYYPFGPLHVLTYGNGRTLTKDYDADYAIDRVFSSATDGLVLDYTTDVMGSIIEASDTLGANPPTRKYAYDRHYRLVDVNDGNNNDVEAFTYNKTGDRTSKTLPGQGSQAYVYLAGTHRLGNVGGVTRQYDANGNTTQRNAMSSLVYDERNRLATSTGPGDTFSYDYSARGERTRKTSATDTSANRRFAYDEAGHVIVEADDAGTNHREYVYADDNIIAIDDGNSLSLVETDQLGTPRVAVNATTNAVQWQWPLMGSAFGETAPTVAPGGVALNLRFPGQLFDYETALNYNYFRDYEPGAGRYVESDPIGQLAGPSTYGYAMASPLNYFDRLGLDAQSECCASRQKSVLQDVANARGFVACCNGQRYSCTIADSFDSVAAASSKKDCRKKHEDVHNADTQRCQCGADGYTQVTSADRPGAECAAYSVSIVCFRDKLNSCRRARDKACVKSLEKEMKDQQYQYARNCGKAFL